MLYFYRKARALAVEVEVGLVLEQLLQGNCFRNGSVLLLPGPRSGPGFLFLKSKTLESRKWRVENHTGCVAAFFVCKTSAFKCRKLKFAATKENAATSL